MRSFCSLEFLESRRLLSNYYVSPSGDDASSGGNDTPWQTLQKAFDTVKPGDVVTVRAGDYAGASKYGLNGTADAPITFNADPGVRIVSNAKAQPDLNVGIELSGIDSSSGSSYITLDGFTVDNASGSISGPLSSGFRIRFSDHITLKNCIAANNGWVGIYTSRNDYLLIDHCESYNNNSFVDSGTARNHGIYVAQNSSHVTVSNSSVHDNNGNGIHNNGDGGVNSNIILENNQVYNNGAIGGSAINCDGIQSSIIRNNLLYNNKNKGIALYNIDATGGSQNNTIVNNTIVAAEGNNAPTFQLKDDGTGNQIFNNIFAGNYLVDFYNTAQAGTTFDNNVYSSTAASPFTGDGSRQNFTQWLGNYPAWDAHSITATQAALFLDPSRTDYRLSTSSPARHLADLSQMPAYDLRGLPRDSADGSVGAYRYWVDGDANFDGIVSDDDYAIVDSNHGRVSTDGTYLYGDLNFDHIVSGDDYTIIDSSYGSTSP